MEPCPICGKDAEKSILQPYDVFTCKLCGKFKIEIKSSFEFKLLYKNFPPHLLSGYVREYYDREKDFYYFKCNYNEVESIRNQLPHDNDVLEKVKKLLLAIKRKTEYPGHNIRLIPQKDYPLAYCQNDDEFHYYLFYLKNAGLISGQNSSSGWECKITIDGWRAIESYKVPNAESEKVFVAMWFHEETNDAYNNGIQPAIENDCGYKSIRIDRKEYLGKVDDEIIAEIRESRFIVADFTGQRHGVYFEAGFAQGLGLPVIWTCHKDHVKDLHFDTRQENHITWETPDELREKLKNRIRAAIGLGPLYKKNQ